MYKEYRDTTINGAVSQMIAEMAGRHRAQAESIQILKTGIIANADVRRTHVQQVLRKNLKFPTVRATHACSCVKSSIISSEDAAVKSRK